MVKTLQIVNIAPTPTSDLESHLREDQLSDKNDLEGGDDGIDYGEKVEG